MLLGELDSGTVYSPVRCCPDSFRSRLTKMTSSERHGCASQFGTLGSTTQVIAVERRGHRMTNQNAPILTSNTLNLLTEKDSSIFRQTVNRHG